MITWPALCPARITFWNQTPKSQLPINRISLSFFALHLLASLKAIKCITGPSVGPIYQNWILQIVGPVGRLVLPAVRWSSYQFKHVAFTFIISMLSLYYQVVYSQRLFKNFSLISLPKSEVKIGNFWILKSKNQNCIVHWRNGKVRWCNGLKNIYIAIIRGFLKKQ